MKESDTEQVSKLIQQGHRDLVGYIRENLKGVKPFGMVRIDPIEAIYHIEKSGYLDDPSELIQEGGLEKVQQFFSHYAQIRQRIQGV